MHELTQRKLQTSGFSGHPRLSGHPGKFTIFKLIRIRWKPSLRTCRPLLLLLRCSSAVIYTAANFPGENSRYASPLSFRSTKFATAYDWMNKHISYLIYPLVPRNNWTLQIIAFQWRTHESCWLQLFDNTTLLWCSSAPGSITHFRLTAIRVVSPNVIGLASGSSASYLQLAILMRQLNFRISFGKIDKTPRAKIPLWAGRSQHDRSGWEISCTLEVSNAALEPCTIIIETRVKC